MPSFEFQGEKPPPRELRVSFSMNFVDPWMYDAMVYGSEAADFGREVRADLDALPLVGQEKP